MTKTRMTRSNRGFSLVEALIAVLLGALLAGVFLDMFSKLMRVNTSTQNEVAANAMTQAMVESLYGIGYDVLAPRVGLSNVLLTNREFVGQTGIGIRKEPLFLDLSTKTWSPKVLTNKFHGDASFAINPATGFGISGAQPEALTLVTAISWSDGDKVAQTGAGRTIDRITLITKNGLHKWTP